MDGIPDKDDSMPLKKGELKPFGTVEYENEIKGKTETLVLPNPSTVKYDLPIEYYNVNDVISLRKYALQFGKEKAISKAAINIMMEDVNKCEDYLQYISDEDWTKFCLYFNQHVQEYGIVDKELHYFRLKLNRAPETLDDMLETLKNDPTTWTLCTIWQARYHMNGNNGEYNLKFVSSNETGNIYEAVYNYDGLLLTEENDPLNMGTYNYAGTNTNNKKHHDFDVDTYIKWGNAVGYPYVKGSEKDKFKKYSHELKNSDAKKYYEEKKQIISSY